jgi:GT2 family glycosyltransferase
MLLIEVFHYLKRRADKRPVYLKNFVDQSHHHGIRKSEPSVAIIVPTRDKVELLKPCIESVLEKTIYKNYEIIVVDNQSIEPVTHKYLSDIKNRGVKVLSYPHKFNYSAICNFAASSTSAQVLCFLNNDTEVIAPGWLGDLADHAIQEKIGIVGSLLLYPDKSVQHAGIALGYTGVAGHPHSGDKLEDTELRGCYQVNAATFACVAISTVKFKKLGQLDEKMPVGLNDVEFCLRASVAGLVNIICTKSVLIHSESKSRKSVRTVSGALRALRDVLYLSEKYSSRLKKDSYFMR